MTVYSFRRELWVARPVAEVFEFFSKAENLERLTPPWLKLQILTPTPVKMERGATIEYALRVRGIPIRWLTQIEQWNPPFEFVDIQLKGPYKLWRHTHRFSEIAGGTKIEDTVEYALPFGILGRIVNRLLVARDINKIFDYRAEQVRALLPWSKF
jgi:ligand-binding SRPBCC domain-containing protein